MLKNFSFVKNMLSKFNKYNICYFYKVIKMRLKQNQKMFYRMNSLAVTMQLNKYGDEK